MQKKISPGLIFMIGCFITGNLVGAGILGLPIKTGMAGFLPSLVGMILVGAALFFGGIVLANEAIKSRQEVFHYPSMYEKYFGKSGRWVAILANSIILYGLITVYLTGSASIITRLLGIEAQRVVVTLVFFAVVTALTISNPKSLFKLNSVFVVILTIAFIALVVMGKKYIEPQRFQYKNWALLPSALPIIVTALNFQNIIPTISKSLNWDRKSIIISLFGGVLIGFVMCVVWVRIGIGVLPLTGTDSILGALQGNVPEIVPLAKAIRTPIFINMALAFSLLAIITSYLSMGNSLMEFIRDCTSRYPKLSSKTGTAMLAFLPPLLVALIYPDIFLNLLDLVGGVGVVVLFGILPCIIAFIKMRSFFWKIVLVVPVLLFFFGVFALEVAQETGLTKLDPRVESWTNFTFYKHSYRDRKGTAFDAPHTKRKSGTKGIAEEILPVDRLLPSKPAPKSNLK